MPQKKSISPALVLLMAVATGLAVSCNYYAQPLLGSIASTFDVSHSVAGLLVTVAQLSYGLGLLLLVPLGDLFERRRMIVGLTAMASIGLAMTGASSGMAMALVGTALTGLVTVVAQLLVPLAATLAAPHERGRVVGTIMSGLIAGVLLGRTVAGTLASAGSWRTVYWVTAPAMLVMAFMLWRALPRYHQPLNLRYPQLIASVLGLMRDEPLLRSRAVLGGIVFAVFSVMWTPMAFLLSAPPYSYSDAVIGLFGLAGAAGVAGASGAGRLADKGHSRATTLWGALLLLVSWVPIALAGVSIWALLLGIVVLDLAVQMVHVSNQSVIYRIRPEARNRITSAYMTCYFIGGASGSLISASAFNLAGWHGVSAVGAVLSGIGLYTAWRNPDPAKAIASPPA